jgi:hypothetical protein
MYLTVCVERVQKLSSLEKRKRKFTHEEEEGVWKPLERAEEGKGTWGGGGGRRKEKLRGGGGRKRELSIEGSENNREKDGGRR